MGLKFLSLQVLPWCFHIISDHIATTTHHHPPQPVRLIDSDGFVKTYQRPVRASELMREYPKHLVCHSDSFYIGQKVPSLLESDELLPGHSYFLFPRDFFQSVLTFVTITSSAFARKNRNNTFFEVRKTQSGSIQIRVSDEFISKRSPIEEEEEPIVRKVCTTSDLEKDYRLLVGCKSRQWKPKLETIRESDRRRLGAAFGMKRRIKPN
ncbi:hypothetical protein QJS04_geneDACA021519 [Acorus gramineus]|uniref:Uncharacterized protein n=1 Tax=Acorus gramineus TaxID=55184 RepID=A0AAV9A5I6_ACOGR|nr:hypothetical protein QJS04_geneDACA021765 [Acorus gramineus]KAK1259910.1 hypothetical protein QJS04_geneDACA021519 [Acorus gramineus]